MIVIGPGISIAQGIVIGAGNTVPPLAYTYIVAQDTTTNIASESGSLIIEEHT